MKKKNSTKKKPTKKPSNKKKKKLLKSTEKATKKKTKYGPTKKTKHVADSEGDHESVHKDIADNLSVIGVGEDVSDANDLADDMTNGSKMSDDDLGNLASGKKEN